MTPEEARAFEALISAGCKLANLYPASPEAIAWNEALSKWNRARRKARKSEESQ